MKIVVLTENSVLRDDLTPEHGLSVYVEKGDTRLLFDTGYYGAVRGNAEKLGVDLSKVNMVAFSHNHVDHRGGFLHIEDLLNPDCPIYIHRGFNVRKWWDHRFDPREDPTAAQNLELVGPAMSVEYFFEHHHYGMRLIADGLYKAREGVYFVSEFPVQRGVETVFPASRMETASGEFVVDEFRDEQACVLKVKYGLVVLAGCAHNGIMNILRTAQSYFPGEKIYAVIGGTHLVPYNRERVERTLEYFKSEGIIYAGVCHCTGPAIADFSNLDCYLKVGAGLVMEFED